jgi:excinuclease ABC subunit C
MIEMTIREKLVEKIKTLPEKPGVYQYYNDKGVIIYVGKAKNLKKRVASYFNKTIEYAKTRILVKKIVDIQYIVVDTELDALLLENNLIKKYQPKYNIQLKDDKTYPWICIKNEHFPRIFPTRQLIKDGSKYFGPYSNVKVMHTLLSLIKELYPLRNCYLDLQPTKIAEKRFTVCLEYHIGNCLGPCIGEQTEENYNESIKNIETILKGHTGSVIQLLKTRMSDYAANFEYELAHESKKKLELLQNFQAKSTIVSPKIHEVDVLTMVEDGPLRFVNFLSIINGAIVHGFTTEVKTKLDETNEDILNFVLFDMRQRYGSQSKEVLVEEKFETSMKELIFVVPQIGDKKSLLELSKRNATFYRLEKRKQERLLNPEKSANRILETIKTDFRLKELPIHMECFDNSNIQGTNPVAACVVFKNGKPSKRDYRHFNIKTVEGPDDFASMEEVVYRRYKRILEEEQQLPQLIIVDGGKGQLSSALTALEKLDLRGKVAIVGIAKRLEEIYFPGDSLPIYIDKRSESLKVIQFMRNEAHRFGITHHRNKRSKGAIQSQLLEIEGIGEKTQTDLMKHFKTVKAIKEASEEIICAQIGKSKGKLVFFHFNGLASLE